MGDKIPVSAQDSTAELLTPLDLGSQPNGEVEVRPVRHHRRRGWWRGRSVLERCLLLAVTALLLSSITLLLYLSGVVDWSAAQSEVAETHCLTRTCLRVASRLMDRMEPTADPCTDFYQYACGRYLRSHVVASDAFYSNNIQHMQEQMLIDIKKLIEHSQATKDIPAVKKVQKLYNSCVNISSDPSTDRRTSREAAASVLKQLGGWPLLQADWNERRFNLTALITHMHSYKVNGLLKLQVSSDSLDTSTYIVELDKGKPLINEGYLLNQTDPHARRQLSAYRRLLTSTLAALAPPHPQQQQQIQDMIQFETSFAKLIGRTPCVDTSVLLNASDSDVLAKERLTLQEVADLTPHFDWAAMLQNVLDVNNVSHSIKIVSVECSPFVQEVSKFLAENPKRVVANYLVWQFVFKNMRFMGHRLHKIWHDFRKQVPDLNEEHVYSSRWKGCAEMVEKGLGSVLSYMYIQHYDKHHIKAKVEEMIRFVKQVFRESFLSETWIQNDMKEVLIEKLDMMGQKIAFPDSVLNRTALNELVADLHFNDQHLLFNVLRLRKHELVRDLRKLLQPVNKDRDWSVRPLQVNAFYHANNNEILFPLGFLQEPFFGLDYPNIANFANIGVVIGHELTHGFDNQGRRHNWGGNVTEWWSEQLLRDFARRTKCIVKQYSKYPLDVGGKNVNGNKTLGENMCDSSGLKQAFRAWRLWKQQHPAEPRLPGIRLSDDKLFFLFYGQVWCEVVSREGWEKYAVDVHSPGRYRVMGVLQNSRQFADTFGCPAGSYMNPAHKCHVWD